MPTIALVVWLALTSHAPTAHSTRTKTPITIVETVAKTTVRLSTNPTSMSRRFKAAYVSTSGVKNCTKLKVRPVTIAAAYEKKLNETVNDCDPMKNTASGTSSHAARWRCIPWEAKIA